MRLTKESRENEGFSDSGGVLVNVHLLAVSGHALETDALWLSVDQNRPVNSAKVFPLCEHVQKPMQC